MILTRAIYRSVLAIFMVVGNSACLTADKPTPVQPVPAETIPAETKDEPPNILLIVGDDHGYADLGSRAHAGDVSTPNLDRLARRGLNFTQAYATSPICNTSRAGLITGSYTQRFGAYWYGGKGIENPAFITLPEVLKKRGYTTGYIGKFHYGKDHKPNHRNFPTNHGFDSLYGFAGGRKHYLVHSAAAEKTFRAKPKKYKTRGESLAMGPVWIDEQQVDQEGFATELLGARARAFIDRYRDRPFFLQVAFNAVHNFTHQLPQSYLDKHGLKGYHDWDPTREDFRAWYKGGRYPNNPEGRAHYLGQLYFLDREIGRLIDHIQAMGLGNNTLVIYIGDNGGSTPIYANNGRLRGSKYTLYEGGIRVPLIIYGSGRYLEGKVIDSVVSAMDLYPTILRAAGIDAPGHIDGRDLTPLLTGGAATPRTLYWDTGHEVAVRDGRWKYRAAFDNYYAVKQMVELELGEFLYDLESDPGETLNLAGRHPEILARLKSQHRRWQQGNEHNHATTRVKRR